MITQISVRMGSVGERLKEGPVRRPGGKFQVRDDEVLDEGRD